MKVLVIFGSKSDAYVYDPLKERLLNSGHKVDFRFLSVHRSPEMLDRELVELHVDVVVAGAGLAAHLPGVLASKLLTPVIGIPCTPSLGGLDAMLSMVQMPFGIPVLCSAPDSFQSVVEFLDVWGQLNLRYESKPIHVVIDQNKAKDPFFLSLLDRVNQLATKSEVEIQQSNVPAANVVNLCLDEINPQDPKAPLFYGNCDPAALCVHVPIVREEAYRDPKTAVQLLQRISSAKGLWTGLNKVGNGFLSCLQLLNRESTYSAVLTNAKKGYIHG